MAEVRWLGRRAVLKLVACARSSDVDERVEVARELADAAPRGPRTVRHATACLLELLAHDAAATVRAQAAESLGLLWLGRATGRGRPVARALVASLRDEAAEVRFWSLYALGQLGARHAVPAMRRLLTDETVFDDAWWPVAEEAADAIHAARDGGRWPATERVPLGLRSHDRPDEPRAANPASVR